MRDYPLMESKIRGIEHELAMNTQPPLPHGSLVHLVGMAIEELKKKGLVTRIKVEEDRLDFLALNGARVYNDMSHLEISSPSYNSPLEAVVYDKVTELLYYYAVEGLKKYYTEIHAYKNNISNTSIRPDQWNAVSYSTHSSILMDRTVCNPAIWPKLEVALIPFIVARIPLIGCGDMVPANKTGGYMSYGKRIGGDSLRYTISPRAFFIRRTSSNDTVDARGLLNQRDDPHANPEKYWRLHDIHFEGLRSPFQIYLRDCLEVLTMTAYEKGYLKDAPRLKDPVNAVKEISGDTEVCNWKVVLDDGSKVDAISDIMESFYLAGIEEMLDENAHNDTDRMGFNLIKATLDGLGSRRLEYFIDGLDWVTKKTLIDEYSENIEDVLGICNQYTLLDEGVLGFIGGDTGECHSTFDLKSGIQFAEDAIPLVDWSSLGGRIKRALKYGPENTRGYLRSLVAREFPNFVKSVEWERVNFPRAIIQLQEPFRFNKEMCGDLAEHTETFSEFIQSIQRIDKENKLVTHIPIEDHERLDKNQGGADI